MLAGLLYKTLCPATPHCLHPLPPRSLSSLILPQSPMAPAVRRRPATPPEDSSSWEASVRRHGSPLKRMVHVASLVGVRTPPTTCSTTAARRQLLPVAVVAANTPAAAEAATPPSSVFATTPSSGCGVITRAATKARMREVESPREGGGASGHAREEAHRRRGRRRSHNGGVECRDLRRVPSLRGGVS